jgi:hypothetical protein
VEEAGVKFDTVDAVAGDWAVAFDVVAVSVVSALLNWTCGTGGGGCAASGGLGVAGGVSRGGVCGPC